MGNTLGRIEDMATDTLIGMMHDLGEHKNQPYLSEERKASISRTIGHIAFELKCRQEESLEVSHVE